ncbi:O-antigen ligase family protein [Rubritalea spongiae]|uniref:O-antigen ligase family protein n=2 Tax=Rubritalea spongiae TaxID=430797 RepID=A0ABW5E121_9BACT
MPALRVILAILILFPLAIGPWYLGSYYNEYRWPLIYATWIAVAASLFLSPRGHTPHRRITKWLPLLLVTLIVTQGLWMLNNTWGEFIENEVIGTRHYFWEIISLDNQPYPTLPGTVDKKEAADRLSYIIPALLYFTVLHLKLASRSIKLSTLCATIFWIGVSIAFLGLAQRFTDAPGFYWNEELYDRHRPLFFATFRSPGIAACYLNLCLTMGLSYLLATSHRLRRKKHAKPTLPICISIGVVILTTAAMSAGSKAGTIFTVITILLWLLTNLRSIWKLLHQSTALLPSGSPHERNIIISSVLATMIFAVVSFGGVFHERWNRALDSDFGSLTHRHIANHCMLTMLEENHPKFSNWGALGYGPGSFMPMFPFFTHDKAGALNSKWIYAHNDPLQTLIEWGWLGTSFWILLIAGSAFLLLYEQLAKRKKQSRTHLFYFNGATIGMFIFLLHSTVDFPFQIESIAISFAAVLSIGWAAPSLRRHSRQ